MKDSNTIDLIRFYASRAFCEPFRNIDIDSQMEETSTKENPPYEDRSMSSQINVNVNYDHEYYSNDETDWDLNSTDISNVLDSSKEMNEYFLPPLPIEDSAPDEPMHKYPFKLKRNDAGNILTVHHTIKSVDRNLRVRIAACCFNELSNKLVVIDRRGNIYVFDFVSKHYWRMEFNVPQATVVFPSPIHQSEYIMGNELGYMYTVNVENCNVRENKVGDASIEQISFSSRLKSYNASNTLIRFGPYAVLMNLRTMQVSHQLKFDQTRFTLKFACFIPNSDRFLTCFTNDSIHLWSTVNLEALHIVQPIKARDRKLRLMHGDEVVPEFVLRGKYDEELDFDKISFNAEDQHFSDGKLLAFSFTPNGNKLCVSTVDGYLLLLSTASLELDKIYKLRDFILKQMVVPAKPKDGIVFAITDHGMAIMLDLLHTDVKLIVQRSNALTVQVSRDGKLLSVLSKSGEVNVWSTCRLYKSLHAQAHCASQVRLITKQTNLQKTSCVDAVSLSRELRNLLKRDRLEAMLSEYGCFPAKYRFIIWSSLLELPSNFAQYQMLIKRGQPSIIKHRERSLKIKSDAQRRAVIKVWSCLAYWCKVFGYVDFMPELIYPFVKQMTKNSMVVFEIFVSLLLNHFVLCFEFHPMPPGNYLAMCENILQLHDKNLCKFYKALSVEPKDYAWSLLINGFSVVLDESQWLILWDHIITYPPYFVIFVVVAFNVMHRECILRLPSKKEVVSFFSEQNPIDVSQWIKRAQSLMSTCEYTVHPQRFIPPFKPIPNGVYPKFLNYPRDWIEQQDLQTADLIRQQKEIDARLRKLELEEIQMKERLEQGLKQEEHVRRLKEMESLYQETMQREEERIACHRKLLLTYQLEARQRKCEVMAKMYESEQRRKLLEMEKDVYLLMRNVERERRRHKQELLFAEDEIRNQEIDLMEQRYSNNPKELPLSVKYYDDIQKLVKESEKLKSQFRQVTREQLDSEDGQGNRVQEPYLTEIELSIIEIQRELSDLINTESCGN